MKSPYMKALNLPAAGVEEPFMKKDIVMGTIGNTHGVKSIAKPHRMASMMRPQRELEESEPSVGSSMIVECESSASAFLSARKTFLFWSLTFLLGLPFTSRLNS